MGSCVSHHAAAGPFFAAPQLDRACKTPHTLSPAECLPPAAALQRLPSQPSTCSTLAPPSFSPESTTWAFLAHRSRSTTTEVTCTAPSTMMLAAIPAAISDASHEHEEEEEEQEEGDQADTHSREERSVKNQSVPQPILPLLPLPPSPSPFRQQQPQPQPQPPSPRQSQSCPSISRSHAGPPCMAAPVASSRSRRRRSRSRHARVVESVVSSVAADAAAAAIAAVCNDASHNVVPPVPQCEESISIISGSSNANSSLLLLRRMNPKLPALQLTNVTVSLVHPALAPAAAAAAVTLVAAGTVPPQAVQSERTPVASSLPLSTATPTAQAPVAVGAPSTSHLLSSPSLPGSSEFLLFQEPEEQSCTPKLPVVTFLAAVPVRGPLVVRHFDDEPAENAVPTTPVPVPVPSSVLLRALDARYEAASTVAVAVPPTVPVAPATPAQKKTQRPQAARRYRVASVERPVVQHVDVVEQKEVAAVEATKQEAPTPETVSLTSARTIASRITAAVHAVTPTEESMPPSVVTRPHRSFTATPRGLAALTQAMSDAVPSAAQLAQEAAARRKNGRSLLDFQEELRVTNAAAAVTNKGVLELMREGALNAARAPMRRSDVLSSSSSSASSAFVSRPRSLSRASSILREAHYVNPYIDPRDSKSFLPRFSLTDPAWPALPPTVKFVTTVTSAQGNKGGRAEKAMVHVSASTAHAQAQKKTKPALPRHPSTAAAHTQFPTPPVCEKVPLHFRRAASASMVQPPPIADEAPLVSSSDSSATIAAACAAVDAAVDASPSFVRDVSSSLASLDFFCSALASTASSGLGGVAKLRLVQSQATQPSAGVEHAVWRALDAIITGAREWRSGTGTDGSRGSERVLDELDVLGLANGGGGETVVRSVLQRMCSSSKQKVQPVGCPPDTPLRLKRLALRFSLTAPPEARFLSQRSLGGLLSRALSCSTRLEQLDFSGSSLGEEGTDRVLQAIQKHRGIRRLRLSGCPLGDGAGSKVAHALRDHPTLVQLDLSDCGLNDEDIPGICALLSSSNSTGCIKSLSLGSNELSVDGGVQALLRAVSQAGQLKHLSLAGTDLHGAQGAAFIARMLAAPQCGLVGLDLSHCALGGDGCALVCNVLPKTQLKTLSIAGNELGLDSESNDALECLEALNSAPELRRVNLRHNGLFVSSATVFRRRLRALVRLAEKHPRWDELLLEGNGLSEQQMRQVQTLLELQKVARMRGQAPEEKKEEKEEEEEEEWMMWESVADGREEAPQLEMKQQCIEPVAIATSAPPAPSANKGTSASSSSSSSRPLQPLAPQEQALPMGVATRQAPLVGMRSFHAAWKSSNGGAPAPARQVSRPVAPAATRPSTAARPVPPIVPQPAQQQPAAPKSSSNRLGLNKRTTSLLSGMSFPAAPIASILPSPQPHCPPRSGRLAGSGSLMLPRSVAVDLDLTSRAASASPSRKLVSAAAGASRSAARYAMSATHAQAKVPVPAFHPAAWNKALASLHF